MRSGGHPRSLPAKGPPARGSAFPGLDPQKIFLNATHTHTGPVLREHEYPIPKTGVTQAEACRNLLADRVADAIVKAWSARSPGSVTWGLGHAVVAYNRRTVYADGTAIMYGPTNKPEFRNLEGFEDHDVNSLFFWNQQGKLIGLIVNVSCPSQEVEGRSTVNADFWHPVRNALKGRFGPQLCVLGWTGAAGDQSPHLRYRQAADDRMTRLRGLDRMDEIARRIVHGVEEAYDAVQNDRHPHATLVHRVETVQLPVRLVTEKEYLAAKGVRRRRGPDRQGSQRGARTVSTYEVVSSDRRPVREAEDRAEAALPRGNPRAADRRRGRVHEPL